MSIDNNVELMDQYQSLMEDNECNHLWDVTVVDNDGKPVFKMNRYLSKEPITNVLCLKCGARSWMTALQIAALPAAEVKHD